MLSTIVTYVSSLGIRLYLSKNHGCILGIVTVIDAKYGLKVSYLLSHFCFTISCSNNIFTEVPLETFDTPSMNCQTSFIITA